MQTYEHMPLLTYCMAIFNETLRMFPTVSRPRIQVPCCVTSHQATSFLKVAAEDTSLVTSNIRGEKCTVPIPEGVNIAVHIPGLHYNRKVASLPLNALS
jgi:hypothetical protein